VNFRYLPIHALAGIFLLGCTGDLLGSADGRNPEGGGPGHPTTNPDATPGDVPVDREVVEELCAERQGAVDVGLSRLRRLTREELDNTLRDLFAIPSEARTSALSADEKMGPFSSNAIAPITSLLVVQHHETAEAIAADPNIVHLGLVPCDLASNGCAGNFIAEFGRRAFRRPLAESEITSLLNLYQLGLGGGDEQRGLRLLMEAILQAPSFLYHADSRESDGPASAPTEATAYVLASRLSYFLWKSMPDEQLFQRAADSSLLDGEVYEREVDRLLADERANEAIASFHRQWLGTTHLLTSEKDPQSFPEYNAELSQAMMSEQAEFAQEVILRGDALLRTLLTADYSYPSADVAAIYGASSPSSVDGPVLLPSDQRSGLLTQAAFLAAHAKHRETSPVHRGIIVRENVMCQIVPPPPPGVDTTLPPQEEATSTRERFAQHLLDPSCAGCHKLVDPIGLGFENYDAIGRFRQVEGLVQIDASGELVGDGAPKSFENAVELTRLLADSLTVSDCVARQWFRFSLGRIESESDACSILELSKTFEESEGNIRSLIEGIAKSESFRFVRTTTGGQL
jgi:hypothetical protein